MHLIMRRHTLLEQNHADRKWLYLAHTAFEQLYISPVWPALPSVASGPYLAAGLPGWKCCSRDAHRHSRVYVCGFLPDKDLSGSYASMQATYVGVHGC